MSDGIKKSIMESIGQSGTIFSDESHIIATKPDGDEEYDSGIVESDGDSGDGVNESGDSENKISYDDAHWENVRRFMNWDK